VGPVVALSGFMGSGKTTVGRLVATALGFDFFDLDDEVAALAGISVAAIFAAEGEAGFRAREFTALDELLRCHRHAAGRKGLVVSLGGGAVAVPAIADELRRQAFVVFLETEVGEAWRRAGGTDRPLARSYAAFADLYQRRRAEYLESADEVVDTSGLSVNEVVEKVLQRINDVLERSV